MLSIVSTVQKSCSTLSGRLPAAVTAKGRMMPAVHCCLLEPCKRSTLCIAVALANCTIVASRRCQDARPVEPHEYLTLPVYVIPLLADDDYT